MEFEFIKSIRKRFPDFIGDDCAVIDAPHSGKLLVTTDEMVENVHFDREYFSLADIGYKSVSAASSDIAAMGGEVLGALFSLSLPQNFSKSDVAQLYDGIGEFCNPFGIKILGGNITRSDCGIHIVTTVLGRAKKPILRSGASVGDSIIVTGALGGSLAGFLLLSGRAEAEFSSAKRKMLSLRHKRPRARIEAGKLLAKLKISSMLDISDGLFSDLSHIADESQIGFSIELEKIPLFSGIDTVADAMKISPYILAAKSGEEYELLFTARESVAKQAQKMLVETLNLSSAIIGRISSEKRIATLDGKEILQNELLGWEHFSKPSA